ncbi:hypothetical protein RSAG8_05182, partial [Rhizoctonia solani AG-8 WAC10335]
MARLQPAVVRAADLSPPAPASPQSQKVGIFTDIWWDIVLPMRIQIIVPNIPTTAMQVHPPPPLFLSRLFGSLFGLAPF